jgi:tetratricopeptide (TPR) repeat protein
VQNLTQAALTYIGLRQFPAALKLCDRVLDIKPNDPDVMAMKARIYQALGNLEEAARFLSGINETSSAVAFETKTTQLEFERNYAELLQLQQARAAREGSVGGDQLNLAIYQWMAGDTAGARVTAEKARNTLEQSFREALEQSDREALDSEERKDPTLAGRVARLSLALSEAYALTGEKDSALKLAERAIMLWSRGGTEYVGEEPGFEENLALIQAITGENSRAISTLTHLLQTSYLGNFYGPTPVTRALLKLDPMWDPLRSDPAFQKLCEEKQP